MPFVTFVAAFFARKHGVVDLGFRFCGPSAGALRGSYVLPQKIR